MGRRKICSEKMVKSAQRREAVAHLKSAHQMCERRACRVAGVDRALVRYQVTKGDDADLPSLRRWRTSDVASAIIDRFTYCCAVRAGS